jgi:hypothetical protein
VPPASSVGAVSNKAQSHRRERQDRHGFFNKEEVKDLEPGRQKAMEVAQAFAKFGSSIALIFQCQAHPADRNFEAVISRTLP